MNDDESNRFHEHHAASHTVHPSPMFGAPETFLQHAPVYAYPPGAVMYGGGAYPPGAVVNGGAYPPGYAPTTVPMNGALQAFTAMHGIPVAAAYPSAYPTGQLPPGYAAAMMNAAFANAAAANPAYASMAASLGIPHPPAASSNDPANQIARDAWSTSLVSCLDHCVPNCLMAFVCPCVSIAHIHTRLGFPRANMIIVQFVLTWFFAILMRLIPEFILRSFDDGFADSIILVAINAPLLVPLLWTATLVMRARAVIRFRFRLPGSGCEDCLVSCCCGPCAIAQMATHIKSYKPGSCSFESPSVLPPYQ